MDIARPYAAVVASLDGDVLTTLWGTSRALTGREVARLVKRGSQAGVHRSLLRLVEQGIVRSERAGSAVLFTLNRDHVAAPAIELLAQLRAELTTRLRVEVARWRTPADHALLFGSAARGDGDEKSDLDLLVVRPAKVAADNETWREQLDTLAIHARQWTGNTLSVAEISSAELGRLRKTRPKIVADLERDAITVIGDSAASLLGRRR